MLKLSLILFALLALSVSFTDSSSTGRPATPQTAPENCTLEFEAFKLEYNKKYNNTGHESSAKQIFCRNLKHIQDHNANPNFNYKMEINSESDLLASERRRFLTGLDPTIPPKNFGRLVNFTANVSGRRRRALPYKNLANETGPIKDQGQCGSCWAFAAISTLQANAFRKTGQKLILSEQNLVDCNVDRRGCSGAEMQAGFVYNLNSGTALQEKYPYRQAQKTCLRPNPKIPSAWQANDCCYGAISSDSSFSNILDTYGPFAIGIDASGDFSAYRGGIFDNPAGCGTRVNHAVVVVGYGTDPATNMDYWIIKNSWGNFWGEKGYIRIKAHVNMCGINWYAYVPCDGVNSG